MTQEEIDLINEFYKSIGFPYTLVDYTQEQGFVLRYDGVVTKVEIAQTLVK